MADKKIECIVSCRKQCFLNNKDGENVIQNRGDKVTLTEGEFLILNSQGTVVKADSDEGRAILESSKPAKAAAGGK